MITYPLNNIEYQAEDAELFHATRRSGIYAGEDFTYSITGADNTIIISPGVGWIRNSRFAGKVVAQKEAVALDMGLPDSIYPRIDAVIIRFDANANKTEIILKTGTAATVPIAPEVTQNETVYELHLYHVRREAGSTAITAGNITDLRMDSNYCGLMADAVTEIDTSAINAQITAFIAALETEIAAVRDGSAYLMRNGTTPMTADLPMGGHRITDMADPEEDGDAVPKKYAEDNFAPAGYVEAQYTVANESEIDTILVQKLSEMKQYTTAFLAFRPTTSTIFEGVRVVCRLHKTEEGYGCAEFITRGSVGTSAWKKSIYNNSALPIEWVNPSMIPGEEYRTTERWNGKAVYTKLVDCGVMPNTTKKSIAHGVSASQIVRCSGQMSSGANLPTYGDDYDRSEIYANTVYITITTWYDFSSHTATAQIWYTKD